MKGESESHCWKTGSPTQQRALSRPRKAFPGCPFSASLSNRAGLQLCSKFVTRVWDRSQVRKKKITHGPRAAEYLSCRKKIWKWIFRYVTKILVYAQITEGQAPELSGNNINCLVEANPSGTCGNMLQEILFYELESSYLFCCAGELDRRPLYLWATLLVHKAEMFGVFCIYNNKL